jgi:hypothetical protein
MFANEEFIIETKDKKNILIITRKAFVKSCFLRARKA